MKNEVRPPVPLRRDHDPGGTKMRSPPQEGNRTPSAKFREAEHKISGGMRTEFAPSEARSTVRSTAPEGRGRGRWHWSNLSAFELFHLIIPTSALRPLSLKGICHRSRRAHLCESA